MLTHNLHGMLCSLFETKFDHRIVTNKYQRIAPTRFVYDSPHTDLFGLRVFDVMAYAIMYRFEKQTKVRVTYVYECVFGEILYSHPQNTNTSHTFRMSNQMFKCRKQVDVVLVLLVNRKHVY